MLELAKIRKDLRDLLVEVKLNIYYKREKYSDLNLPFHASSNLNLLLYNDSVLPSGCTAQNCNFNYWNYKKW